MIKKTIQYIDIDGIDRTEDFYFNLTKAEILELQVSRVGGFAESMQVLVESRDNKQILSVIKEFILAAYGERTDVSRHFTKRPEFAEAFSHTEAFSTLFMDLFQNADRAAQFFEGLMPKDLVAEVKKEQEMRAKSNGAVVEGDGGGPRPRMVPQDHQQKASKVFEVVKDTMPEPVPSQREMSLADFTLLGQEDRLAFVNGAGKIV